MKRDHAKETAAYAAVVRKVVDEVQGLPQRALDGLALVERFVAGDDVSFARLDEVRTVYDMKHDHAALQWALTAIGNLGFFASKARGWQQGATAVMDAATYALCRWRGADIGNELKRTRDAALAKAVSRKTNVKPPGKKAASEAALREVLARFQLPVSAAIVAFEKKHGARDKAEWVIGPYACLTSDAHAIERGAKMVPVAYGPNDVIYYMDAAGVTYARDTIEHATPTRFADDGDALIAALALRPSANAERRKP